MMPPFSLAGGILLLSSSIYSTIASTDCTMKLKTRLFDVMKTEYGWDMSANEETREVKIYRVDMVRIIRDACVLSVSLPCHKVCATNFGIFSNFPLLLSTRLATLVAPSIPPPVLLAVLVTDILSGRGRKGLLPCKRGVLL